MTETDKLAIRDAKRAKRNAKREVNRAKKQKKQRDLQSRTALSPRNIQENIALECSRAIHRNKSLHTNVLRTPTELLDKVIVIPPKKESEHA
jgi:hypothetical protein